MEDAMEYSRAVAPETGLVGFSDAGLEAGLEALPETVLFGAGLVGATEAGLGALPAVLTDDTSAPAGAMVASDAKGMSKGVTGAPALGLL